MRGAKWVPGSHPQAQLPLSAGVPCRPGVAKGWTDHRVVQERAQQPDGAEMHGEAERRGLPSSPAHPFPVGVVQLVTTHARRCSADAPVGSVAMGMSSSAIGWQAVLKPRQPVTVGESINEKSVGQVSRLIQAEGTDTASEAEAVPLLRRALACVCVLLARGRTWLPLPLGEPHREEFPSLVRRSRDSGGSCRSHVHVAGDARHAPPFRKDPRAYAPVGAGTAPVTTSGGRRPQWLTNEGSRTRRFDQVFPQVAAVPDAVYRPS